MLLLQAPEAGVTARPLRIQTDQGAQLQLLPCCPEQARGRVGEAAELAWELAASVSLLHATSGMWKGPSKCVPAREVGREGAQGGQLSSCWPLEPTRQQLPRHSE